MSYLARQLRIELPAGQSAFLWGPRRTGKSTLLAHASPGSVVVDFVLGDGEVAVEVKGTSRLDPRDLRPIKAFVDEHAPRATYVVCDEPEERVVDGIRIVPWRGFLGELWGGGVFG